MLPEGSLHWGSCVLGVEGFRDLGFRVLDFWVSYCRGLQAAGSRIVAVLQACYWLKEGVISGFSFAGRL